MKVDRKLLFLLTLFQLLLWSGCSHPPDSTLNDDRSFQSDTEFETFNQAFIEGKHTKALQLIQNIINRLPQNASVLIARGLVHEHTLQYTKALEDYQNATLINPGNAKAWFNLGVMYGKLGQIDQEMDCYQKAIQIRPDYAKAYLNLGLAYEDLGKKSKAQKAFLKAVTLDPALMAQPGDQQSQPSTEETEKEESWEKPVKTEPSPSSVQTDPPRLPESRHRVEDQEVLPPPPPKEPVPSPSKPEIKSPESVQTNTTPGVSSNTSPREKGMKLNNQGFQQEKNQQWKEAIGSYREALKLIPDDPMIWNNQGIAQIGGGQFSESIASFQQARRLKKDDPDILNNLGFAHLGKALDLLKNDQTSQAIPFLKSSVEFIPDSQTAWLQLIRAYLTTHHETLTMETLQKYTEKNPSDYAALTMLGVLWLKKNEIQKAQSVLTRALQIKQNDPEIWNFQADTLFKQKQYKEAAGAYDACLRKNDTHDDAWNNMGICLAMLDRWNEAASAFEKSSSLKPHPESQKNLADARIMTGKPEVAIPDLKELLGQQKLDTGQLWASLGLAYETQKNWAEAAKAWKTAADLQKRNGSTWAHLGQAYSEIGETKSASLAYDHAVYYGHKTVEVWNNLGVVLSQLGDNEKALAAYGEAVKLSPRDPDILVNIGISFHYLKKNTELDQIIVALSKIAPNRASQLTAFHTQTEKKKDKEKE